MPGDAAEITKKLKDSLETVERLRGRRKELKSLLMKEGATEADEAKFASELASVCRAIIKTEENRLAIYTELSGP